MKILHTADWHIGQRLGQQPYERSRLEEHEQFLNWLLETIQEHQINLLLVCGDIFHAFSPSTDAMKVYYDFLYRLSEKTDTYTVITAGNHDSKEYLEAPREFLKVGRIHVVGLPRDPADSVLLFPQDTPQVAVAAVPYLTESELRPYAYDETEVERKERYRERLKRFYAECVDHMPPEFPKILMGHLYVQGGCVTKSERDLQIGGATATHATDFPEGVAYFALGHLHRPQSITGQAYPIRYSGSPIRLGFKEAKDKEVYLLEFGRDGKMVRHEPIEVPTFREICVVKGDKDKVLREARTGEWDEKYIQVQLALDTPQVGVADEIRAAFSDRGGEVLEIHSEFPPVQEDGPTISIEDMQNPKDIFAAFHQKRYNGQPPDEDLARTFSELLQMVEDKL